MPKDKRTQDEFTQFQNNEPVEPPRKVSQLIRSKIHELTHPSPWGVFAKILGIHVIVGAITLLVCPQFGIGLGESTALYSLFQSFGHYGCMAACGAFFVGTSVLTTTSLLNIDEARVFKNHSLIYLAALSSVSLVTFFGVGGEIFIGIAIAWLIGSLAGGKLSLETIYFLRFRYQFT